MTTRKESPPLTRVLNLMFAIVAIGGAGLLLSSREDREHSWAFLVMGLIGLVQTRARAAGGGSLLGRWKRPLVRGIPAFLLAAVTVLLVVRAFDPGRSPAGIAFRLGFAAVDCAALVVTVGWWRR